jgi:hypothetical protein
VVTQRALAAPRVLAARQADQRQAAAVLPERQAPVPRQAVRRQAAAALPERRAAAARTSGARAV